jgi:hypothetical protein
MGLDTTHDCWHGAYSAFGRWRKELAKVAGYWITKVQDGIYNDETIIVDWGHLQDKLFGDWDKVPDDPLLVLIAHSDCEGVIHPREAKALAGRIEQLLPLLPKGDGGGHIYDWQVVTQKFIAGLREASNNNEDVEFH